MPFLRTRVSQTLICRVEWSAASLGTRARLQGGPNFLFINTGDESECYVKCASTYRGNGELGLACGNWQGPHRLYAPFGPALLGGAKALGFSDADSGGFEDVAPHDRAHPSAMCTVIAVDFNNGIYEEIFFNNIDNSMIWMQDGPGNWVECEIGDVKEPKGLRTGAAVADIDGDGCLELLKEGFNQVCNIFALLACDACPQRLEGSFRSHGAPARGASVKLFDENGHVQKCVIDAGRLIWAFGVKLCGLVDWKTGMDLTVVIYVVWRDFIASNPMHFCVVKVGNPGHQQSPSGGTFWLGMIARHCEHSSDIARWCLSGMEGHILPTASISPPSLSSHIFMPGIAAFTTSLLISIIYPSVLLVSIVTCHPQDGLIFRDLDLKLDVKDLKTGFVFL
ncbi:unnamed protein product [Sphagnum jensenii]